MNRQWIRLVGLAVACLAAAWGQRGNAGGMGHGSPQMTAPGPRSAGPDAQTRASNPHAAAPKPAAGSAASGGTIPDRITANKGLAPKMDALLPAGMTLETASAGFKNMGQFIAALHVSRNLNIPFDQLQTQMADGKKLGQAISALKPDMPKSEVTASVKTAESEAKADLKAERKSGPSGT